MIGTLTAFQVSLAKLEGFITLISNTNTRFLSGSSTTHGRSTSVFLPPAVTRGSTQAPEAPRKCTKAGLRMAKDANEEGRIYVYDNYNDFPIFTCEHGPLTSSAGYRC